MTICGKSGKQIDDLKEATSINNGKYDIPAFFIDPQEIDIHDIDKLVVDGFWSKEQLQLK